MKIGYCVEGATDRALLTGLRRRWCQQADLVEGSFRGRLRRREYPKACLELQAKGADVIVFVRDANDENWRTVMQADMLACGAHYQHLLIVGVCERNVECWLTADRQYASTTLSLAASELEVEDPKPVFERAMAITALERKEAEIQQYVFSAPLRNWLGNRSFEAFYDSIRMLSKNLGCNIENLRDSIAP